VSARHKIKGKAAGHDVRRVNIQLTYIDGGDPVGGAPWEFYLFEGNLGFVDLNIRFTLMTVGWNSQFKMFTFLFLL
jgi:hypothetical protein